jgi:hypothetical protein
MGTRMPRIWRIRTDLYLKYGFRPDLFSSKTRIVPIATDCIVIKTYRYLSAYFNKWHRLLRNTSKNRFNRHKERNQHPHHVPTGSVQQGLNFAIKRKPIQAGLKIG